jgi:hypothetical protein
MMLALTYFVTIEMLYTLLIKDQMLHERSKHIDVKYHYVRDIVAQDKLKMCRNNTLDNNADMMKMLVPIAKIELCSSLVGITVYSISTGSLKWLPKHCRSIFFWLGGQNVATPVAPGRC